MDNVIKKYTGIIHGGDYNPDQWLKYPEILERDIELMKKAGINSATVGIFSWSRLEPEEGKYEFDWLEEIIDRLYDNGIFTVLATPSGAKPIWMSEKYEEIRRVSANGVRDHSGGRHNHCYTSEVYREKTAEIDRRLAQRFSGHPGVILWHISNEFGGECYCDKCIAAFREWLKEKYGDIEKLNDAWWTDFWSHRYQSFEQIEPPFESGENELHGLKLDWKRFVTRQTVDFMNMEIKAVKSVNPDIPCTANLMSFYDGLDYFKFRDLDIVSWDNYPQWHHGDNFLVAQRSAAAHDLMRSIKRQNFLLMENTPSSVNWTPVSKVKMDGMHLTSAVQAIAHGSQSIQYFQFRKSRGGYEKMHGAVVDHDNRDDTKVFKAVTQTGRVLSKISDEVYPTDVRSEATVIYDWENRWAVEDSAGPRNGGIHYVETVLAHHRTLWKKGINVDFTDMDGELKGYSLVSAPMIYMLRGGISEKLAEFVKNGGTAVMTVDSGIVEEHDLCCLGGWPGEGLMDVFGIRCEEMNGLWDEDKCTLVYGENNKKYECRELNSLVHAEKAEILATYSDGLYKGEAAVTVNSYGKGKAYFVGTQAGDDFLDDFYEKLTAQLKIHRAIDYAMPYGVAAHTRICKDGSEIIFICNYLDERKIIETGFKYRDLVSGEISSGEISLEAFGNRVIKEVK
jgi:beta-galactosidase